MADETKIGSFTSKGNGYISEPTQDPKAVLKRKQKKSIEEEFNTPDPVSNAIRSLWKKVRG